MNHSSCAQAQALILCLLLAIAAPGVSADEILLFDDFDAAPLNNGIWGLATWNIGDRTQFGNQPLFTSDAEQTYVRLPLDTYNPGAPGERVLGTEIYSLENFAVDANGIEYLTRARLDEAQGGLVAAFFTYNQHRRKGRWLSDEIDFEVLSNWPGEILVSSWDDWGAAGSDYEDGVHHLGAMLSPDGFDWTAWNTYAMRWYADRVEWWINDVKVKVHEKPAPVPDLAQPARASLWAGGTTWPDAFNASLAPVAEASANDRFHWDIDFIMVTRLGDSGEPPSSLIPPGNLTADVNGNEVQLSWSDAANVAVEYVVYRAWKPRGKTSPDFEPVTLLSPETFSYSEVVQDGEYLYRVTATDGEDESDPSDTVEVSVGAGGKGKPNR